MNLVNNVLIIRLSSLGDVLLTTPLIRALKNRNPKLQIDFVVRKEFADALCLNPYINNLFLYEPANKNSNYDIPDFSTAEYDLVIDLQNNLRSSRIRRKINSPTVRFHKPGLSKFLLVNFKINLLKDKVPIAIRYARCLDNFNLDKRGLELISDKIPDDRLSANKNFIGICPGAKHFTKRWPKEYFIELGNSFLENNYTTVLFGGKEDRELCKEISKSIKHSVDLSNNNDLLQTAADMKQCGIIVCNDSGLMHTSSAVGVPVVAIFGSTVQEFGFAPYNTPNLILENKSLFCRPCSHIGRENCPKKHFKCMKEINPQTAHQQILQFLNTK